MERGATKAASRRCGAPGLKARLQAVGGWLGAYGQLPLIGASAILVIGLGTVAVAVDTNPAPYGAHWLGGLDARAGKSLRLLQAAAAGLGAEVRRVEAERDSQLQVLQDQLHGLAQRQTARIATIADITAIKEGAPSLYEEVKGLRLVAAGLLLREGARSGHPFEPALERFAVVAAAVRSPDLEADRGLVMERIAMLRPYAEVGVVSPHDLRRSFGALTAMVDRVAASSWWDTTLVAVGLRADPLQPLEDAQAALMVDDLAGAVAALAALQGEAALVTEGWRGLAQARLATDSAVDDLYRLALAVGVEPSADAPVAWSGKAGPTPAAAPTAPVAPTPPGLATPGPWQAAQTTSAHDPWSR